MPDNSRDEANDAVIDSTKAALVVECLRQAATHLGAAEISLGASLTDDLTLDSVQLMEALPILENRGGRVQPTSGKPLRTVADLVGLVAL